MLLKISAHRKTPCTIYVVTTSQFNISLKCIIYKSVTLQYYINIIYY